MKAYLLLDEHDRPIRMRYKAGAYPHASVFFSLDDLKQAVRYFGGAYSWKEIEI